jgi:hypothetical protein
MIVDKNTGENYIIEVNASPGVKGISSVSDVSPVNYIFDFLKKFKYINNNVTTIGSVESAKLIFDNIECDTDIMFDMNTDMNVITTKSAAYNEDGNKVSFCIGDKTVTRPVIGTLLEPDMNRSYLVSARMDFNDMPYKNIIFKVKLTQDSEMKIVLGNTFLSMLGNMVSIDPNNTYLVTDKIQ